MNVTFDTNVFVSGFTRPMGRAAVALAKIVANIDTLFVSQHIVDEPDNRILECALAADADLIVTGDRAMLALERIGNTRIVSLADYLS